MNITRVIPFTKYAVNLPQKMIHNVLYGLNVTLRHIQLGRTFQFSY